jgi:mRNA biogenesis factor
LVYKPRRKEGDKVEEELVLLKRNLFDKNGLPRHPERSVYYDPVMNPFGVAPPGMPFMQRGEDKMSSTLIVLTCRILAPLPGEVWSDEETDDGWSYICVDLNS